MAAGTASPVPPAPSELAAQWHALAEEWARWYARTASGFTGEPLLGSIANLALAPFPPTGPVDVERLAALNEKYPAPLGGIVVRGDRPRPPRADFRSNRCPRWPAARPAIAVSPRASGGSCLTLR